MQIAYLSDWAEHAFLVGDVHEKKLCVFFLFLLQVSFKIKFLLLLLLLQDRGTGHLHMHSLYSKSRDSLLLTANGMYYLINGEKLWTTKSAHFKIC